MDRKLLEIQVGDAVGDRDWPGESISTTEEKLRAD